MGDYPLLGDEDLNHEFEPTPEDPHECIHCRAIRIERGLVEPPPPS